MVPKLSVKWLGVWLQHQFRYKIHVEKRLLLAQGALQRLFRISSKTKGLSFNALRQLYLSCVIPVLDYGSVLWYNKYGAETLFNMCDKLQKQALSIITGAYRNSPSKALEVEAALLPTRVRHFKNTSYYSLRLLKLQTSHPIYSALSTDLQGEMNITDAEPNISMLAALDNKPTCQIQRIALSLREFSKSQRLETWNSKWNPPWMLDNVEINISKSSKLIAKNEHLVMLQSIPLISFIIYTDGSLVKDKGCGIGIVIYLPFTRELKCLSFNLGKDIGITDAETYAIFRALTFISSIQPHATCVIFSDSQAALLRINKSANFLSHKIRSECSKMNVKILWCPGHQGIEGNELADGLARKGLDQNLLPRDRFTSYSYLAEGIRKNILLSWRSDWTKQVLREEEGRKAIGLGHFYRISARKSIPNFKTKATNLTQFSRRTQASYFQARTGIGNTLAYLRKIGKVSNDQCNFCQEKKQTMQHLLLHCSFFTKQREREYDGIEPLSLQILFNTNFGRTRLLRFLESSRCLLSIKSPGEEQQQ